MERVKRKIDFTEGKIFFKIVLFILPILATNLLQTFYNAADMMVVSLSPESNAVGAIGTTGSFVNLVLNVFIGFSVGANVVVAREIGAKDREKTQKAVHTSLLMAVIFGVAGMVLGLVFAKPVLQIMGNSGNLLQLATTYTAIYFLGVPFMSLTNFLVAIFRAKGDAKTPLIVLSCAGILNVGLNFFFVVAVGLSVEGVAIATAIANVVSAAVLLIKLRKDQDYTTFSFKRLRLHRSSFRDIVLNGVPAGVQGALFSLSNMLIQSSVVTVNNTLCPPDTGVAPIVNGSAAAANIEGFIYTAMNAVYQGTITVTSQNIGAKKPERVKPTMYVCFLIVTIIGVVTSGLAILFKESLLSLYGVVGGTAGSIEQLAMHAASTRFRCICTFYFLCGLMDVCTGVLRGMNKAIVSTCISLVGACLLRAIWIWTVFPLKPTLEVVFVSYPITWAVTLSVAFIVIQVLLRRMTSKTKNESKEEFIQV